MLPYTSLSYLQKREWYPLAEKDVKKQVAEYIKASFSQGKSMEGIRKTLVSSGWPSDIADTLLYEYAPPKKLKSARRGTDYISRFRHSEVMDHDPTIKFEGVTKNFGENAVLDNVDLEILHGEIFGIIGLSGSGKTTLLNALVGFINLDKGDIKYKFPLLKNRFYSVFKKQMELKKDIGFASQEPSFYSKLTPMENLDHFGSLYYLPDELRMKNVKSVLLKAYLSSKPSVSSAPLPRFTPASLSACFVDSAVSSNTILTYTISTRSPYSGTIDSRILISSTQLWQFCRKEFRITTLLPSSSSDNEKSFPVITSVNWNGAASLPWNSFLYGSRS